MGKITLSGAIPGENNDGVGFFSEAFLKEAKRRADEGVGPQLINVVARIAVDKIVIKTVNGVQYPVMKVHHWEVVPEMHSGQFGEIIGGAFGNRTGALPLPFPDGEVPADPFPEEDDGPAEDPDADELAS